jgi:thioredoxin-related protein
MKKNDNNELAIAKENIPSFQIYSSSMCLDCQKIKKLISEIKPTYEEKINFISINALDKNKKTQEQIKKYGIVLVPTIIILDKNNNQINKIEGYIEKEELVKILEDTING